MNDDTLRILIVEDDAADVALINHELRKGGLDFRSKRVENREDFIRELERNPPDLIFSDHGLPSFDGFSALAIAKEKCPNTPFIFVTGSMGEERAVETVKDGATDYVLKKNLSNLVGAVRRALNLAGERVRRHQAEQALRESEACFRMLVEGVKDYAIIMLDPNGNVASWSVEAKQVHGYTASDIVGRHFSCFYSSEEAQQGRPEQAVERARTEGRFEEEGCRVRKGGAPFWANVVLSSLRDNKGKLCGFALVTRDITERKQSEQSLRKAATLKGVILETVLDAIIFIDHEGVVQEWNPAAQRILGYSRADALGRLMDELIIPPSLREVYQNGLADYLITGAGSLLGRPVELTLRRADGSEFRAELAISRILTEEPQGCTVLIRDITGRRQSEAVGG